LAVNLSIRLSKTCFSVGVDDKAGGTTSTLVVFGATLGLFALTYKIRI
jgi:hypothetical protein